VTAVAEPELADAETRGGGRRREPRWQRVREAAASSRQGRSLGGFVGGIVAFLIVVELLWHPSPAELIAGISIGSLYGIVAVGIILIYRTNRIINFAAAAIGAVPAILALLLDVQRHIPYLAVFPIAFIGGPLVGALVDVFIMRRFSRSPRLILTVVSIGTAQGLAALGFFIPVWVGARAGEIPNVPTPWDRLHLIENHRHQPVLVGNQVACLVTVVVLAAALAVFLRYTRIGIALRAAAENSDRASLLGIPVKRIQTVAWMLAGLLGAMAIFVQSPIIGVPNNATLGFDSLLYALAAAVVARMERIGVALVAGMGVGIIEFSVVARTGRSEQAGAVMLVVILGALLLQRRTMTRAQDAGTSSWDAVKQFRPIPTELRGLPEVNAARAALYALFVLVAIGAPFVVHAADLPNLALLPLYGIVAVSLVVLTGWAGQISLGQFGLVGAGAAAAGGLVANHNIDFFAALAIGIAAGVFAAIVIGLPAVRIQGLYLAVTTLAFGYAMQGYILNKNYFVGRHLLPTGLSAHLDRPLLYGRVNLENNRTFYFVCLIALVVAVMAATAFRRNRSGRVLIAARDNQRAAPAYSINLIRTRLAAFAVSGGIAGMAGVLFAYSQHNVIPGSYGVLQSIVVFLAAVIGGLTSVPSAVAGVIGLEIFTLFGPRFYQHLGENFVAVVPLILTGPLLVLELYFYPGGSAEANFQLRDRFLRWVAHRRGILVPSLIADRRVEQAEEEGALVDAERHVEELGSFEVLAEPTIACPVCGLEFRLPDAAAHEHLKPEVRT
jgi:branched-chain amino acid transport system permease protein